MLYMQDKKDMTKAKRMILDGVHDHIISHIVEKNTAKDMWEVVLKLYQDPSENCKMILKGKLRTTKMQKGENVTPYLTKV